MHSRSAPLRHSRSELSGNPRGRGMQEDRGRTRRSVFVGPYRSRNRVATTFSVDSDHLDGLHSSSVDSPCS